MSFQDPGASGTPPQSRSDGPRPPALAVSIAEALLTDPALREATLGDLAEDFDRIARDRSDREARAWYWSQVRRSMYPWSRLAMTRGFAPWLQLVGSIVIGYVALVALVVASDIWLMPRAGDLIASAEAYSVASLVSGMLCAFVAGAIAAAISPRAPLVSAAALGVFCFALSVYLLTLGNDGSPLWYRVGIAVIVFPSVIVGALLYARIVARIRRRTHRTPSST